MDYLKTKELFKEEHSIAYGFLCGFEYPWQALGCIKDFILEIKLFRN